MCFLLSSSLIIFLPMRTELLSSLLAKRPFVHYLYGSIVYSSVGTAEREERAEFNSVVYRQLVRNCGYELSQTQQYQYIDRQELSLCR